jgi:hypothetical protein
MFHLDGNLREATLDDIREGHILRMVQRSCDGEAASSAFSDHIIVKVEKVELNKTTWVRLVRPFAYVHLTGTMSPGPLFGHEDYKVDLNRLVGPGSLYRVVLMSTGEPAKMCLDRK